MPEEYQFIDMEHNKTGESFSLKIGPMPINMRKMESELKKAFKEAGKKFTDNWIIKKAWIGPESSHP